jgi:hypothetical protein
MGRGQRRPTLTIRCRADLYAQVRKAAEEAGRSASEEIEHRLEHGFARERFLTEMVVEALARRFRNG